MEAGKLKTFYDIRVLLFRGEDLHYTLASRIVDKISLSGAKTLCYKDEEELGRYIETFRNIYDSKEVLILKEFPGRKFQKCPGSPGVICCNYYLLNTCFNCLYDCTYCFLNSYLNSYGITQFINLDKLHESIFEHSSDASRMYRIGTGEFTDSLMMDEITGIAENLIMRTSRHRNIFLEFKTKSDCVDHLLPIKEKGSTVLAWTLNTPVNISRYEKDTASLDSRVDAAAKAGDAGFYLAFHFDPIITYDGFLNDYDSVLNKLSENINPGKVVWVSLGCFRYSPGFKDIIKHKYRDSVLTCEEMFPGVDGKYRYLKKRRIEIYSFFYKKLRALFPLAYVYFCMESADVWYSVTGNDFASSDELEAAMGHSLRSNFL